MKRLSGHPRFTLIEVAIAAAIFAAAIASLLAVLGGARSRIVRAERQWARAHLLASAAEFHLLAGPGERIPDGVLPEGFASECIVEDIADLPEEADDDMRGWKLVQYHVAVKDPMGETVLDKRIRKIIAERW